MIYLGKFLHATNQQEKDESERRHGEFNLIVEAQDRETAEDLFKRRIIQFRQSTDLFQGDCYIFLVHLLELEKFPRERAKMLFYKSVAGDPVMPYISCSVPTGEAEGCRILQWSGNKPDVDGIDAKVFIDFKDE
jgi:hypothetical protein